MAPISGQSAHIILGIVSYTHVFPFLFKDLFIFSNVLPIGILCINTLNTLAILLILTLPTHPTCCPGESCHRALILGDAFFFIATQVQQYTALVLFYFYFILFFSFFFIASYQAFREPSYFSTFELKIAVPSVEQICVFYLGRTCSFTRMFRSRSVKNPVEDRCNLVEGDKAQL